MAADLRLDILAPALLIGVQVRRHVARPAAARRHHSRRFERRGLEVLGLDLRRLGAVDDVAGAATTRRLQRHVGMLVSVKTRKSVGAMGMVWLNQRKQYSLVVEIAVQWSWIRDAGTLALYFRWAGEVLQQSWVLVRLSWKLGKQGVRKYSALPPPSLAREEQQEETKEKKKVDHKEAENFPSHTFLPRTQDTIL